MATETKTFYPQAHDTSDYKYQGNGLSGESNPVGKGTDNTTYASIYAYNMTAYVYWPFDVSAIPDDAKIDSVVCKAKMKVSATNNFTGKLRLYSGTTAKGSEKTFTSTTATIYTLTPGTWSRAELDSIRLRTAITTSTGRYLYFYGADLTVTYTYQSEQFMLKVGGSWEGASRVFKKVNGIWVEQTDLANVIEDGVRYQNGGEIESTRPTLISFTVAGTSYKAEPGMTWGEWCDSGYNTAGFKYGIDSFFGTEVVQASNNSYVTDTSGSRIKYSAVITSGYAYSLS